MSFPRATALYFLLVTGMIGPGHLIGQEPSAPAAGTTVPEAGEAESSDGTAPGIEAVKRVRNLGFRLNAKGPAPAAPDPPAAEAPAANREADAAPSGGTPESGELRIGRLKDPVALPPEVAELAKEGALAVSAGEWEQARDLYLEMVKIVPDSALAYANLGVAEHQLGNLLAAAGNLGKSTELNPHIARNWQTLGLIHYERGELALALSCLTRAVHEGPGEAETRLILAAVARDYGWPEAAVTELQRAVEINPKLAAAHYNLAITYLETDPPRLELARRHYHAAIDLGTAPSPEIEAILKPAG